MKTAEVNITTEQREFPAATQFAGFRFRVTLVSDPTKSAEQLVSVTTVQFAGLAAGQYSIDVAAINGAGDALSEAVSMLLEVPEDATVMIAVPTSVSATLL